MKNAMRLLSASLLMGLLVLSGGKLQAAPPGVADVLEQLATLQESIADLESSGELDKQQAKSLTKKLGKVEKALAGLNEASTGDVTVQQQGSFLRELQRAIDALLDFISALTELVTELPAEVVQPIIDAAIELLRDLLGLLLGGGA
jgi:hypothetical protein